MTILILSLLFAQPAIPVTTLAMTELSAAERSREAVAQTSVEWNELWRSHEPDKPAPPVDLSKATVLAVFLGARPTSGYRVEITRVHLAGGDLIVEYAERRPAPDSMVAQILTSPCHIVSVPKHGGPVRFIRREEKP